MHARRTEKYATAHHLPMRRSLGTSSPLPSPSPSGQTRSLAAACWRGARGRRARFGTPSAAQHAPAPPHWQPGGGGTGGTTLKHMAHDLRRAPINAGVACCEAARELQHHSLWLCSMLGRVHMCGTLTCVLRIDSRHGCRPTLKNLAMPGRPTLSLSK